MASACVARVVVTRELEELRVQGGTGRGRGIGQRGGGRGQGGRSRGHRRVSDWLGGQGQRTGTK